MAIAIRHLSYRATLALEPGEPRTLEAQCDLDDGHNPETALRELHDWVEDQLFLLADVAADARRRKEALR